MRRIYEKNATVSLVANAHTFSEQERNLRMLERGRQIHVAFPIGQRGSVS